MKVEMSFNFSIRPGMSSPAEESFSQPSVYKSIEMEAAEFNEAVLRDAFEDFVATLKAPII